jgi:hypothetical protein
MDRLFSCSITGLILILAMTVGYVSPASAQQIEGNIGLGGQVGEPTGLSMKVYNPEGMSYDFLAAFDLNDFFYLNVHGLFERSISDTEPLNLIYGPGAFLGIYDRPRGIDDEVALGISGQVGINFYIEQFELFARVTPRIEIVPGTSGDVGGGLGFRYYF